MIFIIGGKGLVGSAIVNFLEDNNLEFKNIQRENKHEFYGKECDILIYANGNAKKYLANADPLFDFVSSVESAAEYIHKIKFKKFVLISTIDVYEYVNSLDKTEESIIIDTKKLNNYGFHKLLVEQYVQHFCKDYLIFRLSGLCGVGLQKNPLFDFIHEDKKVMISKDSRLNFINTKLIPKVIFKIINLDIKNEIFNLASTNSIKIGELKDLLGFDSKYTEEAERYVQNYEINVKKISQYVKLNTSEEAILEYYKSIAEKNKKAE